MKAALQRQQPVAGKALATGMVLVASGMIATAAAAAAPMLQFAGEHRARVADMQQARARSEAAAGTLGLLDLVWTRYDAKILRVQTGVDEPTSNERDIIASFRGRLIDQLSDSAPADVLAAASGETASDADFAAQRAAFLSTFNDVNAQMAALAEHLNVILDRPLATFSAAEFARLQNFFSAETSLEDRWLAVHRAAQRVRDEAVEAQDASQQQLDAERSAGIFEAGLAP